MYLHVIHFTSHDTTSHVFVVVVVVLSLSIFRGHSTIEPALQQCDLFYFAGLHRNQCQSQLTQEKFGRGFGKNAGEWTGRVEISEEEIPDS